MPHCSYCNRGLADSSSLRRHVRTKHPETGSKISKTPARYECTLCQLSFTRNESLERHRSRKHSGRTSKACDICLRILSRDDYLHIHQLKCAKRFLEKACRSVEDYLCPGSYQPDTSLVRRVESSDPANDAKAQGDGRGKALPARELKDAAHFAYEYALDVDTVSKALKYVMSHALAADSEEECEEALSVAFRLNIRIKAFVDIDSLSSRIVEWAEILFEFHENGNLDQTLWWACDAGFISILEPLYWKGARFDNDDQVNRDEDGLLAFAVQRGSPDIIRFALTLGADPDVAILHGAIEAGRPEVVILLIEHGANINDPYWDHWLSKTALEAAVSRRDLGMTNLLLSMNADASLGSPLYAAVLWRLTDIATTLVRHGADIDKTEPSLWLLDQVDVDESVLGRSLQKLFDYDSKFTALVAAVYMGSIVAVELALSLKADPNIGNPLLMALETDLLDIAALLVKHGADISVKDRDGKSPLHFAAARAHVGLLQAVLLQDSSPEFVAGIASGGNSALHLAIRALRDHPLAEVSSFVRALVNAGADPNAADEHGTSALTVAVIHGSATLVRTLLAHWAPLAFDHTWLFPALEAAIWRGNVKLLRILADAGARDESGTLLEQAKREESNEITEILESSNATMPATSLHEARKAMELVLSFFKPQPLDFLDLQESITVGKLMEKLISNSNFNPSEMIHLPLLSRKVGDKRPLTPSLLLSDIQLTSPGEARKAMDVVLCYFEQQHNGCLDMQESIIVGKLMEKFEAADATWMIDAQLD